MSVSTLLKIIILGSILVAVKSLEKCCRYGHLYRSKEGKLSCVDIQGPSNVNKKYVHLILPPAQCPTIETRNSFDMKCKDGYTCKDILYDEESKLAVYVKIDFSLSAKNKWEPFTKIPKTYEVRKCCPFDKSNIISSGCTVTSYLSDILHSKYKSYNMEVFGQNLNITYYNSMYCGTSDTLEYAYPNSTFIEEPFLESPMHDHPMIQYFKTKAEDLDYCVYTYSNDRFVFCSKDRVIYSSLRSGMEVMNTDSKNQIFVCTDEKYKLNHNSTLTSETIMSASPLKVGPLDQLISHLRKFSDHNRVIRKIIKDGEKSFYWKQHERKFNCSKGIRPYKTVTITNSGELYSNIEKKGLSGEIFCLSPVRESKIYMTAYVCEGFAGQLPGNPQIVTKSHRTSDDKKSDGNRMKNGDEHHISDDSSGESSDEGSSRESVENIISSGIDSSEKNSPKTVTLDGFSSRSNLPDNPRKTNKRKNKGNLNSKTNNQGRRGSSNNHSNGEIEDDDTSSAHGLLASAFLIPVVITFTIGRI